MTLVWVPVWHWGLRSPGGFNPLPKQSKCSGSWVTTVVSDALGAVFLQEPHAGLRQAPNTTTHTTTTTTTTTDDDDTTTDNDDDVW